MDKRTPEKRQGSRTETYVKTPGKPPLYTTAFINGEAKQVILQAGTADEYGSRVVNYEYTVWKEDPNAPKPTLQASDVQVHSTYDPDPVEMIDGAIAKVSAARSRMGAIQNRLEHAYKMNTNTSENSQSAESRIRDTDMAEEMVNQSKHSILQQSAQSLLAQANQMPNNILSLLPQ